MIENEGKLHYAFIKDFNSLTYNQTRHCSRKRCCYCLQSFRSVEILERHGNNCFKTNGKQMIKTTKRHETVNFRNFARKLKSLFMIHADFKGILVPGDKKKKKKKKKKSNFKKVL